MTHDDHAIARDLATEAGALLLRLRADRGFGDLKALRAAGDRESHVYRWQVALPTVDFVANLATRSSYAALPPEHRSTLFADILARLDADRVWIVDPLDGTRVYAEVGRGDWAVHVALWERDGEASGRLTAGAVRPGTCRRAGR